MTTTLRWMLLGSVLGFSISMGLACGPAKCTPSNCSFGCCDATGACQPGGSDTQCGGSGNMCSTCGLGQRCQLGLCTLIGGTGGGTTGGGTGGGTTGGGTGGGTTGGGTGGGTTGGGTGGGTTGGGTGGGTTGGGTGGGVTGGGTGGGTGDQTCVTLASAANTFFQGQAMCGQLTNNPNQLTQCNAGIGQCNTSDRASISSFSSCVSSVPCSTGNEANAQSNFFSCLQGLQLSQACQSAVFGGGPTGGGGGGPPTGGGTGGGPTGGGTGGGPTGGGTGGGPSPGCTTLSTFPVVRSEGGLTGMMNNIPHALIMNSATDPTDFLELQFYGSTTPLSENLANFTWATCNNCAILSRGCTFGATVTCTGGQYLGRFGSMTVSGVPTTANPTANFVASLSSITFTEWDLNLSVDMAVPNARCVTLPAMNVSIPP